MSDGAEIGGCSYTQNNCQSYPSEASDADNLHDLDLYSGSWLYSSSAAATSLFDGSTTTVLHALVSYFYWFSQSPGISKEALSSMLSMQYSLLPHGNKLPQSYNEALNAIEPYLVQPVVYHVCKNDCIVFRNGHAHLSECPKCHHSRYVPRTSIPVRSFTYLPLKPRLARFFGTSNLAGVLQSHTDLQSFSKIYDIQQSKAWSEAYSADGIFHGDPRGISLAFCTDGVNPFSHSKVQYSMWPLMFTLLNLPRKMRNNFASILLVGIVPANGTKEPMDLNPYLDIVVDELLEISNSTLYDAYKKAPFQCKAEVLLYVLDYPGISKVMSVVGSGGYQGCMFCNIQGERNSSLQKVVYLQNRRFLPPDSEIRNDKKK